MFGKNNHMDERMLWIRGNVFKHGFILAIVLLMANGLVQDTYGAWATPWFENLLLLIILVTAVSLEMILRDVYAGAPSALKLTVTVMSLCGLVLLVLNLKHIFMDGIPLWQDDMLTTSSSGLLMAAMYLAVPLTYLIRQQVTKRRLANDED